MSFSLRIRAASRVALVHLLSSMMVALLAAVIVLHFWYPHPYGLLSGGRKLFLILVSVDVVCGPLLTLILFNPKKPQREIWTDMALVILIQLSALAYGMHTAYQARPLFLIHEVDRFRVIALPDYQGEDVLSQLDGLSEEMRPSVFGRPIILGIRSPRSREERNEVMIDSVTGGRDYSQRPEFYVPYDSRYSANAIKGAKPLHAFIQQYPSTAAEAESIVKAKGQTVGGALFLPVVHKQDWVAVLDEAGNILGFLPGDGFSVVTRP